VCVVVCTGTCGLNDDLGGYWLIKNICLGHTTVAEAVGLELQPGSLGQEAGLNWP